MNYQPEIQAEVTSPSMNLASMICGIIGLLMCVIPFFGTFAPGLALLFGLIGRGNQIKLKGQGLAGVIMGAIGIVINVVATIVMVAGIVYSVQTNPGLFMY